MPAYTIIELPTPRWAEARALRLRALQSDPGAFASSYADELAFANDVWRTRAQSAAQRAGNMTWYAQLEGELLGMAGATWSQREKNRHVAQVYGVYVRPAQRGKGIGGALMRRLLAELARLPQIEKVSLQVNSQSLAAIALYAKLGFHSIGIARRELRVGGRYYDLAAMELHFSKPPAKD
ncbi:MAG: GNAT family N-acetyltransferase [Chloroflexi bacterium]|nr:GNAT family N-acetyltransferase [Chloroflexota bacterium]MCY3583351.1 GNAT family N-acetyltransferase [Chloroflexota bacterium]MCY3717886.1 GNAT family N-acetyltransferase [Chloroflexota bacterium]MDE2650368.1 GNAT family N-acetyltransferase [Chloroflexota bacterium]MXV93015.1 N-acetyltransferase [Chloroflexota bacterium]